MYTRNPALLMNSWHASLLSFLTMMSPSMSTGASDASSSPAWRQLKALPDEIGFAGMFAGVLDDRLVAGGGSQFRDKPLWLSGEKSFSDRIFVLSELDGEWAESATKLPRPMAHFASAASSDAIYLAGGADGSGCLSEVYALKSAKGRLVWSRLADLPVKLAYGAAVVATGRLYVAGGQSSLTERTASAKVWSLAIDEKNATWRSEADLPDGGTFVGAMAEAAGEVYFLGGVRFSADGKSVQSSGLYRLDSQSGAWERLPDMPEPRVGPLTPCPVVGDQLLVAGGYATAFAGERRDHPGFSRQCYVFDLKSRSWRNGPVVPHVAPENKDATSDKGPAPMVAAPGVVWRGHAIGVSGEVRASVRTPSVLALPLEKL